MGPCVTPLLLTILLSILLSILLCGKFFVGGWKIFRGGLENFSWGVENFSWVILIVRKSPFDVLASISPNLRSVATPFETALDVHLHMFAMCWLDAKHPFSVWSRAHISTKISFSSGVRRSSDKTLIGIATYCSFVIVTSLTKFKKCCIIWRKLQNTK